MDFDLRARLLPSRNQILVLYRIDDTSLAVSSHNMSRSPRIEFPGAIYHVFNRGNYRKPLFKEPGSGYAFEQAIMEVSEASNWYLHAYAIMSNHYHLLLETPDGNLSAGMHWLQGTFAGRFNRYHNEIGHVFQGRFKSPLVEPGVHQRRVADYIHLNPVRAGISSVMTLHTFPLSSFRRFWNSEEHPRLIRGKFLDALGLPDNCSGMRAYRRWLLSLVEDKNEEFLNERGPFERTLIIGTPEYCDAIVSRFGDLNPPSDWGGPELRELLRGKCESIISQELKRLGRSEEDLVESPKLARWKIEISRLLRRKTNATNPWIANRLNMGHPSNVSRYLKRMPKSKG